MKTSKQAKSRRLLGLQHVNSKPKLDAIVKEILALDWTLNENESIKETLDKSREKRGSTV